MKSGSQWEGTKFPHKQRPQLSCSECRRRKTRVSMISATREDFVLTSVKCDRLHPCGACLKAGLHQTCNFLTSDTSDLALRNPSTLSNESSGAKHSNEGGSHGAAIETLQGQIRKLESHLEGLSQQLAKVSNIANGSNQMNKELEPTQLQLQSGSAEQNVAPSSHYGHINLGDNGNLLYSGVNSWDSLIVDVNEIKEAIKSISKSPTFEHPSLMAFPFNHEETDLAGLFSSLPPKPYADYFLERFLTYIDTLYPLIHAPSFRKDYQELWSEGKPQQYSVLSLAFAGIALGLMWLERDDQILITFMNESKLDRAMLGNKYKACARQCLVSDGFLKNVVSSRYLCWS